MVALDDIIEKASEESDPDKRTASVFNVKIIILDPIGVTILSNFILNKSLDRTVLSCNIHFEDSLMGEKYEGDTIGTFSGKLLYGTMNGVFLPYETIGYKKLEYDANYDFRIEEALENYAYCSFSIKIDTTPQAESPTFKWFEAKPIISSLTGRLTGFLVQDAEDGFTVYGEKDIAALKIFGAYA